MAENNTARTTDRPNMLEWALRYATELGWHVFPTHWITAEGGCSCGNPECRQPGKHPVTPKGKDNATCTEAAIIYWWTKYPEANIAVACGPSGIVALDLDNKPGVERARTYIEDEAWRTAHSVTGGGGNHLLFQAPAGDPTRSSQTLWAEGTVTDERGKEKPNWLPLEYKGATGQLHVWPSLHASGKRYEWISSPFDTQLLSLPANVRTRVREIEQERRERQRKALAARQQYVAETPDLAEVADALSYIPERQTNWEWVELLMAVHSAFPDEQGVALVESWSPGYEGEVQDRFEHFNGNGGITLNTLFHKAMAYGWRKPRKPSRCQPKPPADPSEFLPPDLIVPDHPADMEDPGELDPEPPGNPNYTTRDGRLCQVIQRTVQKGKQNETRLFYEPVADFSAKIVRQIDGEEGQRTFVIAGEPLRGARFEVEVDAVEFGQPRKLAAVLDAAAGALSGVNNGMTGHLGPAIKAVTTSVQVERRYARIGWNERRTRYLLPGREYDNVTIDLQNQIACYGLNEGAQLETGLAALQNVIEALDVRNTTAVLSGLLAAPLIRLVDLPRYGLFIRGRSGSLKTSWTQVAMCLYGDFVHEDALIKFGSTYNSLVHMAASTSDAPIFLDNFKPNTRNTADFTTLIHMVMEGREKNRMTQGARQQEARTIHTLPIITGEDVPEDDGATLARLLIVPFGAWKGGINEQLNAAQTDAHHLNAVGRAWIEWLEQGGREVAGHMMQDFNRYRARWAQALTNERSDVLNPLRLASNLAANEIVYRIALQQPAIGPILARYEMEHLDGLRRLAGYMAETTAESMEAVRFIQMIKSMLLDDSAHIADLRTPPTSDERKLLIGWQDEETVYLHMQLTKRRIERAFGPYALSEMSDRQIWAQLESIDLFQPGQPTKPKVKRIPAAENSTQKVLMLDREKFYEYDARVDVADVDEVALEGLDL